MKDQVDGQDDLTEEQIATLEAALGDPNTRTTPLEDDVSMMRIYLEDIDTRTDNISRSLTAIGLLLALLLAETLGWMEWAKP